MKLNKRAKFILKILKYWFSAENTIFNEPYNKKRLEVISKCIDRNLTMRGKQ